VATCGVLEDCIKTEDNPFRDIIKDQFLLWFSHYMQIAQSNLSKDGAEFVMMPFEYPENGASGKFNYAALIERLNNIKTLLEAETEQWKVDGKKHTSTASGWRYLKLKNECEVLKQGISLEGVSAGLLSTDNIYYYNGSIFGPENTPYEGGIYNFEIVFSGSEDAPPRVRFITEMFHPHISKLGIPFLPLDVKSRDPVQYILRALLKLLQRPINSSQATWVNVEAAKMFFAVNNPDMQREYKRRVARCLRNSVE